MKDIGKIGWVIQAGNIGIHTMLHGDFGTLQPIHIIYMNLHPIVGLNHGTTANDSININN